MSMPPGLPLNQRVYLTIAPPRNGRAVLGLTKVPSEATDVVAVLLSRGMIAGASIELEVVTDPGAIPGLKRLGDVTVAQNTAVVISAGPRRVAATLAGGGLVPGEPLFVAPLAAPPAGYLLHDAIATSETTVSVAVTAPLLAIGANYSIPCRLYRLP